MEDWIASHLDLAELSAPRSASPWAKIIENLAVVDYDTNNLYLAAYDWRVSMWNLEERDGYFSKLKSMIEGLRCVYVGSADGMPDWNAACVGSGKGPSSGKDNSDLHFP